MPALKGQRPWSKKQKPNPYADRGLDQFALVSADLQAARDRLIGQLGTQVSLVRFASGTSQQSQWVPIIVAPTSSKAEMRALRRAALDLVAGGIHAFDAGSFGHHAVSVAAGSSFEHLGSSIGEFSTYQGSRFCDNSIAQDRSTHLGSTSSKVSIKSRGVYAKSNEVIGKHANKRGIFGYLVMATQGFLWVFNISLFGLRIVVALACKAIFSERPTDGEMVRTLPSSSIKDKNVIVDRLCADMASSSHSSSQAQPTSIAQRDTKQMMPSLPLHVKPSKTHTPLRFSSMPSSPRACSEQLPKALSASVSLPKMAYSNGHTLCNDIKENSHAQKTNPNKVVKGYALKVGAVASKISPESLGQALSAAGLVLVLGGLVKGFIPAILSVVCWWYMLPRMRKAVGDKPFVRSRHHYHGTQENKSNSSSKKEVRSTNLATNYVKNDMQEIEHKKKVITDGLLERR